MLLKAYGLQQALGFRSALPTVVEALERGHVLQELPAGQLWIEAGFLRQVAKDVLDEPLLFVVACVPAVNVHAAARGLGERGEDAHQRGLARTVRAEEAEHASPDLEGYAVEGADPLRIGLGEAFDADLHGVPPARTRASGVPDVLSSAAMRLWWSWVSMLV